MNILNNTSFQINHYGRYWELFLKQLTICKNHTDKTNLIHELISSREPRILSFINAHAANLMYLNVKFTKSVLNSDYLLRDGSGIYLMMKLLGFEPGINLNGTDLIPEILKASNKNITISVYGTKDKFLQDGVAEIEKLGFNSVFSEDGFHKADYYLTKFVQQQPNIVILAMGMPKQETLSVELRNLCKSNDNVLIINGGGVIDFMSKRIKRAPVFMQNIGCEWLYRLINNPTRLWKRNLGSFIFIFRTLKLKASSVSLIGNSSKLSKKAVNHYSTMV